MTDIETPPIEDSVQRKTASGESGGLDSKGAVSDKLNNHILDDSPTERKPKGKWKDFAGNVLKDEVIKGLAKPGVKVFLSSDGRWWRKKPGCNQTYQYFERPTKQAPERAETGKPEQSQGVPERVNESAIQDDVTTDEPEPDDVEAVRKYRNFKAEHYVNDRLFRDGLIAVLGPSAVKLALFLGSKCGKNWTCFHSHKTISAVTGLSASTIKRAVPELIESGMFEVTTVTGTSNRYRLL